MPVPWYDDWKLSPPEPKVIHTCEECGYEITKGEMYLQVDDTIICTDKECLAAVALKKIDFEENYA